MEVPELLLEFLDDLINDDFRTFKFHLANKKLEGCKPIPRAYLENASRTETVTKMIARYSEEPAVAVTVDILHRMGQNDAARRLTQQGSRAEAGTQSTAAAAAAPPAASSAPARPEGVVIAPNISGSTTGSWNISIQRS